MKKFKRFIFLLLCSPMMVSAQTGFGFKFGADVNHFANQYQQLVKENFSNINIGPYYKQYNRWGGVELGVNLLLKQSSGGLNLPLLMKDYDANQNTALSATEVDFKCGPRFGFFYPQIGIELGYRYKVSGFVVPNQPLSYTGNQWYSSTPFGFALDLPTGFGTAGVGFFYKIALTNFLHNPVPGSLNWDGGNLRALNFDIHVLFGNQDSRYVAKRRR